MYLVDPLPTPPLTYAYGDDLDRRPDGNSVPIL